MLGFRRGCASRCNASGHALPCLPGWSYLGPPRHAHFGRPAHQGGEFYIASIGSCDRSSTPSAWGPTCAISSWHWRGVGGRPAVPASLTTPCSPGIWEWPRIFQLVPEAKKTPLHASVSLLSGGSKHYLSHYRQLWPSYKGAIRVPRGCTYILNRRF